MFPNEKYDWYQFFTPDFNFVRTLFETKEERDNFIQRIQTRLYFASIFARDRKPVGRLITIMQ